MIISEKKTKAMIINFSKKKQFHTRLQLNNKNIEVVDSVKILGTVFNKELTWTENCSVIIRKVNARMQLLQKVLGFGATHKEMVELWKTYCRSVLEQSCIVWGSSLTEENKNYLERTQKTFTKLILGDKYTTYKEAC